MLTLVTPSKYRAVTLEEAKDHCKASTDEDALIDALIDAAHSHVESYCSRALITQTWDLKRDGFPCSAESVIELPSAPLQSVVSISYVDTSGVTQTWGAANYLVHAPAGPHAQPGWITLAYDKSWPTDARSQANAVTIRFVAGYGDGIDEIPGPIKAAMLLIVGDLYANRETHVLTSLNLVENKAAEMLLWPFRIIRF